MEFEVLSHGDGMVDVGRFDAYFPSSVAVYEQGFIKKALVRDYKALIFLFMGSFRFASLYDQNAK